MDVGLRPEASEERTRSRGSPRGGAARPAGPPVLPGPGHVPISADGGCSVRLGRRRGASVPRREPSPRRVTRPGRPTGGRARSSDPGLGDRTRDGAGAEVDARAGAGKVTWNGPEARPRSEATPGPEGPSPTGFSDDRVGQRVQTLSDASESFPDVAERPVPAAHGREDRNRPGRGQRGLSSPRGACPGRCFAGSGRPDKQGGAAPVPRAAAGTAPSRCGATS
jgi:hypothetical protein